MFAAKIGVAILSLIWLGVFVAFRLPEIHRLSQVVLATIRAPTESQLRSKFIGLNSATVKAHLGQPTLREEIAVVCYDNTTYIAYLISGRSLHNLKPVPHLENTATEVNQAQFEELQDAAKSRRPSSFIPSQVTPELYIYDDFKGTGRQLRIEFGGDIVSSISYGS